MEYLLKQNQNFIEKSNFILLSIKKKKLSRYKNIS